MPLPTKFTLYAKNDQYVEFDGLIDGTTQGPTPTYINNATGTLQVLDSTGTPVVVGAASATSVPMNYVSSSNGNYRGLIQEQFNPPLGDGYTVVVDLSVAGTDVAVGHWEVPAKVVVRKQ